MRAGSLIMAAEPAIIPSDEILAERASRDDRQALEALLERHVATAAQVAFRVLRNDADALDAAQAALIHLAQSIKHWSGGSFRAWVCVTAHRAAIDLLRRTRKAHLGDHSSSERADEKGATMTAIEREELMAAVHEELAALPEQTSSALILFHLQGLPVAQVAAEIKLSIHACQKRLTRGREELRQRLERRGIGAMSLLALPALLDESLFMPERLSQKLTAHAGREMVSAAVHAAHAAVLAAGAESFASSSGAEVTNAPSSALPFHGSATAGKAKLAGVRTGLARSLAMTALVLIITGSGWWMSNLRPHVSHDNLPPVRAAKAVPPAEPENDEIAPVASSRWQPQQVLDYRLMPQTMSVQGNNIALFAHGYDRDKKSSTLWVIRSSDGGQTWAAKATELQTYGGVSWIDAAGRTALARVQFLPHPVESKIPSANYAPTRQALEWRIAEPGKTLSLECDVVWEQPFDARHFANFDMARSSEGTWLFLSSFSNPGYGSGPQPDKRPMFKNPAFQVFFSPGTDAPKLIHTETTFVASQCAWARDSKTGGCVAIMGATFSELTHYFTEDGGETFQKALIPCSLPLGSRGASRVTPLAMDREGDRLALLLCGNMEQDGVPPQANMVLLLSDDLGRTWSEPRIIGDRQAPYSISAGKVHICGSTVWVAGLVVDPTTGDLGFRQSSTKTDVEDDLFKPGMAGRVAVFTSDDLGKSWQPQPIFADSGSVRSFAAAGDGNTFHVATYSHSKRSVLIASCTAGTWSTGATPARAPSDTRPRGQDF